MSSAGSPLFTLCALVALAGAGWASYRAYRTRSTRPLLPALVWCLPWGLAAVITQRGASILLDAAHGTAELRQPTTFWYATQELPLSQIRSAQAHDSVNQCWIALVLANDREVEFRTVPTSQDTAARAINDYLGQDQREKLP